jgi:hypothetical protein
MLACVGMYAIRINSKRPIRFLKPYMPVDEWLSWVSFKIKFLAICLFTASGKRKK